MTPIETALKQIGHLNKMRRDGSWLLGPCPRCCKNETLETFAIHEIAGSPHWLCGRCNLSGKTIASLEAFIAGEQNRHLLCNYLFAVRLARRAKRDARRRA